MNLFFILAGFHVSYTYHVWCLQEDHLANIRELWHLLRSADRPQIHKLSEHIHTITLPLHLKWPFGDKVGNVLFVRPSQQPIVDVIMDRYKKAMITGKQLFVDHLGFIVKGTPGIGKSHMQTCYHGFQSISVFLIPEHYYIYFVGKTTFLNLLLYHAAQLNTDVIIHNVIKRTIFILRKDGTVDYHMLEKPIPTKVGKLLATPSTLYLFNPDEGDTQAIDSSAFTVIATSPDLKNYSNLKKIDTVPNRYLSPWTLEEAVDANNALPPDQRQEESTIRERYPVVGGAFRTLISQADYYSDWLDNYSALLETLKVKDVEDWVKIIRSERSAGDLKISHYLFHCFPKKVGATGYILGFAEENAQNTILKQINIKTDAEWERFVKLMLGIDASRTSLGLRYENFIHAYMRNYKDLSIKLRVLDSNFDPHSVLEETPVFVYTADPEEEVVKVLANPGCRCAYVVPSDPQYPAIDSFYIDCTTVYCFQVTVNKEHKFVPSIYDNTITRIKKLYQKAATKKAEEEVTETEVVAKATEIAAMVKAAVEALTFKYCWVIDPLDTQIPLSRYPTHYFIDVNNIYLSRPKSQAVKNQQ